MALFINLFALTLTLFRFKHPEIQLFILKGLLFSCHFTLSCGDPAWDSASYRVGAVFIAWFSC